MFLEPDEHIIIIEDAVNYPLGMDDLKKIEDAGIKTVLIPAVFYWDEIYKQDSPILDWLGADIRIEKYLNTNLKLMLAFYYSMPQWFPDSWYINMNPKHTLPNYANEELGQAIDNFAGEILEHYKDIRNRIHLVYSIPFGGEFLWDGVLPDPYPVSDEFIHRFIINRQKILVKQYGEIWLFLHTFLGGPRNWNNTRLPFLYQALVNEFPDVPIYSYQAAHFAIGNAPTNWECQSMVTKYHDEYGIKFFVGSQYCEGLLKNFDAAIKQKVQGFITGALFNENPVHYTSIEPWMVEAIKETNRKFKKVYND